MKNREPFVAAMTIFLCDMIEAAGERDVGPMEMLERIARQFPDATRGELVEAIRLYMSRVPANDG